MFQKLLCPHCINSDCPLEGNGLSWLKCPLCGQNFRESEVRGQSIQKGHLSSYLTELLTRNKEVDSQMDNIVSESTDNLMHEIIMTRIFRKRAEKEAERIREEELNSEKTELHSEIDKIFNVILGKA